MTQKFKSVAEKILNVKYEIEESKLKDLKIKKHRNISEETTISIRK